MKVSEKVKGFVDGLFDEVEAIFPGKKIKVEGLGGDLHQQLRELAQQKGLLLEEGGSHEVVDLSVYGRPKKIELLESIEREAVDGLLTVREVFGRESQGVLVLRLETSRVRDLAKFDYQVFPRIAAYAERLWNRGESLNYRTFQGRLEPMILDYRHMGIQAGEIDDDGSSAFRLDGVKLVSTIEGREGHGVKKMIDWKSGSFFWSKGGVKAGDVLRIEFPYAVRGKVKIETGSLSGRGQVEMGVVEVSEDGVDWSEVGAMMRFLEFRVMGGVRFVRLRFLNSQKELVVRDLSLSQKILQPVHEEFRTVEYGGKRRREVELGFQVDFSHRPEVRVRVEDVREVFFEEWLDMASKLGVLGAKERPTFLDMGKEDVDELMEVDGKEWGRRWMVERMKKFPQGLPEWFQDGVEMWLMNHVPEKIDHSKVLEGGGASAGFVKWMVKEHGDNVIGMLLMIARAEGYAEEIWEKVTQKNFQELLQEFQGAGK